MEIQKLAPVDVNSRPDFKYILDLIPVGSRVLDLGCGNGDLMYLLKNKGVRCQGIEKNGDSIYKCIRKGLTVHHGDIDDALSHHLDKSFDYLIMNQSIQETKNPGDIIVQTLRIGKKVIIVFPNFSYWEIRWKILLNGQIPKTKLLPYKWHNTPNLHYVSIIDFKQFLKNRDILVEDSAFFTNKNRVYFEPEFFAELALFIVKENIVINYEI